MNAAQAWNIFGIFISSAGVVVLFYYAMPYRTRTGGKVGIEMGHTTDPNAIEQEGKFDTRARIGLGLVIIGAICQMVATLKS